MITHKLNDIGRKLSIELRNDYSNQASGNYQQSSITYYQLKNDLGADSVLYRNQYRESPARNLLLAGEVSYTEPIGKQMLQVYYRHEYQRQSNNAVTYNLDEDAFVTYSKEGKVTVNSKVIREKEEKKVKAEPEYNQLLVPAGKRVRVELSDGTRLVVNSQSKSDLSLSF